MPEDESSQPRSSRSSLRRRYAPIVAVAFVAFLALGLLYRAPPNPDRRAASAQTRSRAEPACGACSGQGWERSFQVRARYA
jgi:hypothetical protein